MIEQLNDIIKSKNTTQEEKELTFLEIQKIHVQNMDYVSIKSDIINLKNIWEDITTARITKIIKKVFDIIPCTLDVLEHVLEILEDLITWAEKESKKMLKLDLECKRIYVYIYVGKYHDALKQISIILKELKKYDDKINLITLYVYESKAFYKLKNAPRAKASLTSARALAVSTYCSSELQAQIDLFNGMYLCDERNYNTAFSYFLESLEGFSIDKKYDEACISLKYLIISKIISKRQDEIDVLFKNKHAFRFINDSSVVLLINIGKACYSRSLKEYSDLVINNKAVIDEDDFLKSHLEYLYDILLESNIQKIVEPYSVIYLQHISDLLNFDLDVIEKRIRKMILDKSIKGILNHSDMSLILYSNKEVNQYGNECLKEIEALEKLANLNY